MLVYLASYPRSGNSLLQQILLKRFGRLASQVKQGARAKGENIDLEGLSSIAAPTPPPGWTQGGSIWNEWTAIYRYGPEGSAWRRKLLPISPEALSLEFRGALAAEPEIFVLKTHHPPFDRYVSGESVVHLVRHPGPTLWSYFRYTIERALRSDPRSIGSHPPTLDRVVGGDVQFGDWSAHGRQWLRSAEGLRERYMRLTFRELREDQPGACARMASFLGVEPIATRPVDFESYSRNHPQLSPRGTNEGFERLYSRAQLERLWSLHGPMAELLGFAPPNFEDAGADEQVTCLGELLERCWHSIEDGRPSH